MEESNVVFMVQPNFFTQFECQHHIDRCEAIGFSEIDEKGSTLYATRRHGRSSSLQPDLAGDIFQRLVPLIPDEMDGMKVSHCTSNIRFYRYTAGQSFGCHIDESNPDPDLAGGLTKLTVLVYLSGGKKDKGKEKGKTMTATRPLVGGETIFYNEMTTKVGGKKKSIQTETARVAPQCGTLLVHSHGDRCLTHEASPVVEGIKYVLRTDVVYGPKR